MSKTSGKHTITADPKVILKALKKFQKNGAIQKIEHKKTNDNRDYLKIVLPIKLTHVIIFQEKNDDGKYTSVRFLSQWNNTDNENILSTKQIHDYNANALWGKAYFDDDHDVNLEMMLDLQQPILKKHLHKIYRRWLHIHVSFHIKYIQPSIQGLFADDEGSMSQVVS